jgi:hypothetical protein
MKLIEFTRDMRPHKAGETRVVPDTVADKLIVAGDAKPRDSVFDKPVDPLARGKSYPTRRRGG